MKTVTAILILSFSLSCSKEEKVRDSNERDSWVYIDGEKVEVQDNKQSFKFEIDTCYNHKIK